MTEAVEFIDREFGSEVVKQLCLTNPAKLLEQE
jgi:hypothetical protein